MFIQLDFSLLIAAFIKSYETYSGF